MKKVASLFSAEALGELKNQLGVELSDEHDYSEDELADLYNQIGDDFPYEYEADGEPKRLGRIFEEIIDVFAENQLIEFN